MKFFSELNSMTRNFEIKIIRKQGVKLQTYEKTFGKVETVAFDLREEMLYSVRTWKYKCFSNKCTNLSASDIEGITKFCNVGQCHIGSCGRQAVTQSGPIKIKFEMILMAGVGNFSEFRERIKCADFSGMGDVEHAGLHLMFISVVCIKSFEIIFNIRDGNFSMVFGKCENFVAGSFYSTGFMNSNVSGYG